MQLPNDKKPLNLTGGMNLKSVAGFLLSGFLLWWTIHSSGLHLRDLSFDADGSLYFVLAVVFLLVSFWISAVRMKLFWTSSQRPAAALYTFDSLIIGDFYNCLLPGNLGDVVRAWHFSKKNNIPFLPSLSSIMAEKWLDSLYFAVLTIMLFSVRPFIGHFVSYAMIYTFAGVIVLWSIYLLMRYHKKTEKKLVAFTLLFGKPGKVFYRLYWFMANLIGDMIRHGLLARYTLYCIAVYLLNSLQFFVLMKCAGIAAPVGGVYGALLITTSIMIIAFIPSAPSNIGVLHYGIYATLIFAAMQCGIQPDAASLQSYARFAIYVHLSYVVPELTLGLIILIKERRLLF